MGIENKLSGIYLKPNLGLENLSIEFALKLKELEITERARVILLRDKINNAYKDLQLVADELKIKDFAE
jgi:hypothetical protein